MCLSYTQEAALPGPDCLGRLHSCTGNSMELVLSPCSLLHPGTCTPTLPDLPQLSPGTVGPLSSSSSRRASSWVILQLAVISGEHSCLDPCDFHAGPGVCPVPGFSAMLAAFHASRGTGCSGPESWQPTLHSKHRHLGQPRGPSPRQGQPGRQRSCTTLLLWNGSRNVGEKTKEDSKGEARAASGREHLETFQALIATPRTMIMCPMMSWQAAAKVHQEPEPRGGGPWVSEESAMTCDPRSQPFHFPEVLNT